MDTLENRLLAKVLITPDGHYIWTGACDERGWPRLRMGAGEGKAHRIWWELEHGPIPPKMKLVPGCGRASCVRPAHMRLISPGQLISETLHRHGAVAVHGEANPHAKLSSEEVAQIRNLAARDVKPREIAERYATPLPTIRGILAGRRRRDG